MLKHGLNFFISGAEITVDEMGDWCAASLDHVSEYEQEKTAHYLTHQIINGVMRKVKMAQETDDRTAWVRRNPPNHAGYYYCHLCGGWVHIDQAELDHIDAKSKLDGQNPNRDDNRRMAHVYPIIAPSGQKICPGNREKGSSTYQSVTLEIRPPDEAA